MHLTVSMVGTMMSESLFTLPFIVEFFTWSSHGTHRPRPLAYIYVEVSMNALTISPNVRHPVTVT